MCQQTDHTGFALCRSDHFRKRRFITSIAATTLHSFSPGGNVPKRTTHTRRTDSAKSRNQQHGISGNAVATTNKQRNARNPRQKRLWQITPNNHRAVTSDWLTKNRKRAAPPLRCIFLLHSAVRENNVSRPVPDLRPRIQHSIWTVMSIEAKRDILQGK